MKRSIAQEEVVLTSLLVGVTSLGSKVKPSQSTRRCAYLFFVDATAQRICTMNEGILRREIGVQRNVCVGGFAVSDADWEGFVLDVRIEE